jgi:hypothetical protein
MSDKKDLALADSSRRAFVQKTAYIAPTMLSFGAFASFAQSGSWSTTSHSNMGGGFAPNPMSGSMSGMGGMSGMSGGMGGMSGGMGGMSGGMSGMGP